MNKGFSVSFLAVALLGFFVDRGDATTFTAGDLAVERIGDGSAVLTSSSFPVFVDTFHRTGTLQTAAQTIGLPNAASRPSSNPFNLTDSGSATSNGYLSLSTNQQALVLPGYNGINGDASIAGSSTATISRTVGVIDFNQSVDTSRSLNMLSGNNFRSVASTNGTEFWAAGAGGLVYVSGAAPGTATSLSTTFNGRNVNIFNNQLYVSTGSGTRGIYSIGTGLPTSGTPTATNLFDTGSSSSPFDFAFSPDGSTLYIADDRSVATGGGIQKWTLSGSTWSLAYTLGTGTGSTVGARGLAVDFSGANPVLFATTAETSLDRLITITDAGSGSAATTLATAPANEIFRGVDFVPVPEPSSIVLAGVGLAGLGLTLMRRR
jgi:hypothetical protein